MYVYETFSYFVGSFTNCYENMWPEREDRGSLEHHINRKFMVNVYQGSEIQENTRGCSGSLEYGNIYSTLVGKCFEMAIWKTGEFGAYYDEDKCHMTDCWPFK